MTLDLPRISVVVPAYNPGPLLHRALASVLSQTMGDLEVVVVDDGSPEDLGWVAEMADPRVRLVRQANAGVSAARNAGVLESRASHVAFLDQDDEWLPGKLERQVASIEAEPEAVVWHTGFDWVTPDRVIEGAYDVPVSYRGLLSNQMICLSTAVVSRRAYVLAGGHNPLFSQAGEYELFLRLAMTGRPIALVPEMLVRYHLHGDNASQDYARGAWERDQIIRWHLARARAAGDVETERACRAGLRRTRAIYGPQAFDALRAAVRRRDVRAGARHLGAVLRLDPRLLGTNAVAMVKARAGGE